MYQQWLRVYMRTQMIKHNKDLLESVDDTDGPAGEAARLLRRWPRGAAPQMAWLARNRPVGS